MDRKLAIIGAVMVVLLCLSMLAAYIKDNGGFDGFWDPLVPETPKVTVSPSS